MFKNKNAFGALVIVFALTILVSSCGADSSRKDTDDPQTIDLRTLSAEEISAYRWNAMANFYSDQAQSVDLRTLSAGDISAYRWNAMANFYSSPSERLRALAAE